MSVSETQGALIETPEGTPTIEAASLLPRMWNHHEPFAFGQYHLRDTRWNPSPNISEFEILNLRLIVDQYAPKKLINSSARHDRSRIELNLISIHGLNYHLLYHPSKPFQTKLRLVDDTQISRSCWMDGSVVGVKILNFYDDILCHFLN